MTFSEQADAGGPVTALGRSPDGDLLLARPPNVCSLSQGRCEPLGVEQGATFFPDVKGRLALRTLARRVVLFESFSVSSTLDLPFQPTSMWAGREGRLMAGSTDGGVFAGPP